MTEVWKPIPSFEGFYEISNIGRVRSVDRVLSHGRSRRGIMLKTKISQSGHINARLCKNGAHHWKWVHRLVLEAFVGKGTVGDVCCHNNGQPSDNRVENLRWDTPAGNEADKITHGTIMCGSKNGMSRLSDDDIRSIRQMHISGTLGKVIAARFCVTPANISSIIQNKTWRHVR